MREPVYPALRPSRRTRPIQVLGTTPSVGYHLWPPTRPEHNDYVIRERDSGHVDGSGGRTDLLGALMLDALDPRFRKRLLEGRRHRADCLARSANPCTCSCCRALSAKSDAQVMASFRSACSSSRQSRRQRGLRGCLRLRRGRRGDCRLRRAVLIVAATPGEDERDDRSEGDSRDPHKPAHYSAPAPRQHKSRFLDCIPVDVYLCASASVTTTASMGEAEALQGAARSASAVGPRRAARASFRNAGARHRRSARLVNAQMLCVLEHLDRALDTSAVQVPPEW